MDSNLESGCGAFFCNGYAARKEEVIKEVANEYKEIIPKDVYDALINYKVLLENDKNYKVA